MLDSSKPLLTRPEIDTASITLREPHCTLYTAWAAVFCYGRLNLTQRKKILGLVLTHGKYAPNAPSQVPYPLFIHNNTNLPQSPIPITQNPTPNLKLTSHLLHPKLLATPPSLFPPSCFCCYPQNNNGPCMNDT